MCVFEITINYPVLCQKICIDLVIGLNFSPIRPTDFAKKKSLLRFVECHDLFRQ